jgi:hypothetical protein
MNFRPASATADGNGHEKLFPDKEFPIANNMARVCSFLSFSRLACLFLLKSDGRSLKQHDITHTRWSYMCL